MKVSDVILDPDSAIGEFTCGEFSGHASRKAAKPEKWDEHERRDAIPAHWSVCIDGVEGAWRELRVPLKPGRTLRHAILEV